jgi:hypothetical protein
MQGRREAANSANCFGKMIVLMLSLLSRPSNGSTGLMVATVNDQAAALEINSARMRLLTVKSVGAGRSGSPILTSLRRMTTFPNRNSQIQPLQLFFTYRLWDDKTNPASLSLMQHESSTKTVC